MWALALAVWGLATGALVPSMNDFVESDPAFREILAGMGMEVSDLSKGFVGMTATIVGVALSVYAASRVGSAREEEATTRLDHVTTRSVPRRRWLGGQVLLTLVSVLLLAAVAGSATWTSGGNSLACGVLAGGSLIRTDGLEGAVLGG
jgi:ABC-2 type transport system permease protein